MREPEHARPFEDDPELATAAALARWLDQRFVDPLVGLLLPGVGDLIGTSLGLYTLRLARRRGAPPALLARILLNLALDLIGGSIPILGDLWDFAFRAHVRNLELLRTHLRGGTLRSAPSDWLVLAGAALLFAAALALPIALLVALLRTLIG